MIAKLRMSCRVNSTLTVAVKRVTMAVKVKEFKSKTATGTKKVAKTSRAKKTQTTSIRAKQSPTLTSTKPTESLMLKQSARNKASRGITSKRLAIEPINKALTTKMIPKASNRLWMSIHCLPKVSNSYSNWL